MSELDQISFADLPKEPGVRILRSAEAEAWQDGYRFLAEVRSAAQRLEETARQTYESEYTRGYADGRTAGAGEAARLLTETTLKVDRYLGTLQHEIGALALNVVRRVLGDFDATDLVARATVQALGEFRREKWLKVTVHPVAVDRVRAALAAVSDRMGPTVTVETDPGLDQGACVVASDFAVVDASVETQLQAFAAAFDAGGRDFRP